MSTQPNQPRQAAANSPSRAPEVAPDPQVELEITKTFADPFVGRRRPSFYVDVTDASSEGRTSPKRAPRREATVEIVTEFIRDVASSFRSDR